MLICKLIVTLIIYLEPNWFFFGKDEAACRGSRNFLEHGGSDQRGERDSTKSRAAPPRSPHPVSRLCPCLRCEGIGRGRPCLRAEGPGAEPGMAAGPDSLLRRPLHAIAIRLFSHHFLVHFGFWDFWKGIFHI